MDGCGGNQERWECSGKETRELFGVHAAVRQLATVRNEHQCTTPCIAPDDVAPHKCIQKSQKSTLNPVHASRTASLACSFRRLSFVNPSSSLLHRER
eukprot:1172691-Rhodomonas_salina.2